VHYAEDHICSKHIIYYCQHGRILKFLTQSFLTEKLTFGRWEDHGKLTWKNHKCQAPCLYHIDCTHSADMFLLAIQHLKIANIQIHILVCCCFLFCCLSFALIRKKTVVSKFLLWVVVQPSKSTSTHLELGQELQSSSHWVIRCNRLQIQKTIYQPFQSWFLFPDLWADRTISRENYSLFAFIKDVPF
jgi:hypothetical protein